MVEYDRCSTIFHIIRQVHGTIISFALLKFYLWQGQHISFTQQIQQFMDTFQQFVLNMGEHAAANHISDSVFYISIGINDYIHYYLFNISNVQNLYPPWNFNQFLAATIRQEIKVIWLYSSYYITESIYRH